MNTIELSIPCRGRLAVPLAAHETFSFRHREAVALEGRLGHLWVTESGQLNDYVLAPNQRQRLDGKGHVVVQALVDAELLLMRPATADAAETKCDAGESPAHRSVAAPDAGVSGWRTRITHLAPYLSLERMF